MSIYKRGAVYWFNFVFNGQHVQESTKQGNPRVARQIEAARKTQLAKGEVEIEDRQPVPTFTEFAQRFLAHLKVHCADKARTFEFWEDATNALLSFKPFASARLDRIDEALIARYVERAVRDRSIATVNRRLATLRRALRLAQQWRVIDRVPRISMLPGERNREFVLSATQAEAYLAAADEPLRSVATLLLETGLRLSEALALRWQDVYFDPVGDAGRGYIAIRQGKTKYAKRNVSLTAVGQRVLLRQKQVSISDYVFVREDRRSPVSRFTLSDQHERARTAVGLPKDFVIHSLRHTLLTNLGAAGVDAFDIQRIAGHSSITISQRYVHPTPESLERAFDRLERSRKGRGVTTVLTTGADGAAQRVM